MIAALTRAAPADSLPIMVGMPMVWACPLVLTHVPQPQNLPPSTLIKNGKVVRN